MAPNLTSDCARPTGAAGPKSLVAALICVLAGAGCALDPQIDKPSVKREAPTGFAAGERVAILLSSYDKEGVALAGAAAKKGESRQWQRIEERLESCLKQSMLGGRGDLSFVSPGEARRTLFPGNAISEFPHDPAEMLQRAGERESRERLAALGLRYVVLLEGRWSTNDGKFEGGGFIIGGALLYGWDRFSRLRATVVDLTHRRSAGEVVVYGKGDVGGGVLIFLPGIPVPFLAMSDPESEACAALGKGLAGFISE